MLRYVKADEDKYRSQRSNSKNEKDTMKTSGKICVISNGCPENRNDGARMQQFSTDSGWTVSDDYRDANVILFNACGLTNDMEDMSIKIINQIKAGKKPSAKLIVCGCLAKINKDRLKEVYHDLTFGSDDIEQLAQIIETKPSLPDIHANCLNPLTLITRRLPDFRYIGSPIIIPQIVRMFYNPWCRPGANIETPDTFFIKVSTGCLYTCSYCGIRLARGKLKSKPLEKVLNEFEDGVSKGYREFALIGTEVGSYGKDHGITLAVLLKELVKRKGDFTIKLRNIHPCFLIKMMPEFLEILRSGKISYILTAAESGNNRILELMNRGYRIEDFKEAIHILKRQFPEIIIKTQIMIGFPGETEEEFNDTVRLLDEVVFDFVEVYIFHPRPNTKAATMKEVVPEKAAQRRFFRLFMKSLSKAYKLLW